MRPGARLMAMIAVATAVALSCPPASAQQGTPFYTGNDLWSQCTSNAPFQSGFCAGFVAGIADILAADPLIIGQMVCAPLDVTTDQKRDVVKRYLEQHPERWHYAAASLVLDALAEAFPCKP